MNICERCDQPTVGKSKYCKHHRVEAREAWKARIAEDAIAREMRDMAHQTVYLDACKAAQEAYETCTPEPIVVYETVGLSNVPRRGTSAWVVPQGVCGFAWIVIRPATGSFARWCAKNNIGHKNYGGGWAIPSSRLVYNENQSYEQKVAAMQAAAKVLRDNGIVCRYDSRLD